MKFILFNEIGILESRFDSDIHGDDIPADAVEVSDTLFFQTIKEKDGLWKRDPNTGDIAKHPCPPPLPYVPQQVTNAQGAAALIQAGLWGDVLAYVDAMTDPTEKALAEVALHRTTHWSRESPFLNAAATALGMSSEDLDNLFIQASEIEL